MNYRSFFWFAASMGVLGFSVLGITSPTRGSQPAGDSYLWFAALVCVMLGSLSAQIGWAMKGLKERLDRIEAQLEQRRV